MPYPLLQLIVLLLPGWLLCRLLRIEQQRYLFSVSLSYSLFVTLAAVVKVQHGTSELFLSLCTLTLLLLAAANLFHRPASTARQRLDWMALAGAALVAGAYLSYRIWAGPYAEIPADLYRHLEYAQAQLYWIEKGFIGRELSPAGLFNQGGQFWYTFYALLTHLSGAKIIDTFPQAMLVNGTLFLLAVYSCAYFLFGKFNFTPTQRTAAAVLSALFVSVHMGINVFAYLRYYGMAPTMLNFILFYTAIVCISMLLEQTQKHWRWVAILVFFTFSAALVHTQEALYIVVLGTLMLAWSGTRSIWPKLSSSAAKYWPRIVLGNGQVLLLLALLASALLIEIWAYTHLERAPLLQHKVVTVANSNPFLNRLPVLNPRFQFAQVLTVWGGLVYLLFLFNIRSFAAHPYFVAGMALPLFTVFNPLFVDLFLRFDNSHTLWRLCYAIPLHFVGAWLAIHYTNTLTRDKRWLAKGEATIALALLGLLLLPLNLGDRENTYARSTLAPVSISNDYRLWGDVIDQLNSLPRRETILTDPVTGYVISALTGHRTLHYKFLPNGEYKQRWKNLNTATQSSLDELQGWLLLINRRDGAASRTGDVSRHWPVDIMKISEQYPRSLDNIIDSHPERFKLLWAENRVALYRIAPVDAYNSQ